MSSKRPAATTAASSTAKKEKLKTGDKEEADANDDAVASALKPGSDNKRLLKLKEEGEAKRRDGEYQNTFLWCENVRDTFLILSLNEYDLWHAVKTSKTWGELRARVSKKFYRDEVEFRILEFPEELVCDAYMDIYHQPTEDGDPFDSKDLRLIGQTDQLSWELLFPPIIEEIANNSCSSWHHWLQEQRTESVCGGMGFPQYVHRMKDKDKILQEGKKRGLKVQHAPELATLSESVLRYEKRKEDGYCATWERNEGDKLSSYEDWMNANEEVADY